jgi:hypothetical protein
MLYDICTYFNCLSYNSFPLYVINFIFSKYPFFKLVEISKLVQKLVQRKIRCDCRNKKYICCCREFYYIQMEKYARQAVSEGVKNADDLHVGGDSELYRVLNLHYNRNNHIEVWGPQVRDFYRDI